MSFRRDAGPDSRGSQHKAAEVHCPKCEEFQPARLLHIPRSLEDGERNFCFEDQPDIAWLRRKRRCLVCGEEFLTAEIGEDLLHELARLRRQLGERNRESSYLHHRRIRSRYSWLDSTGDDVPYDLARRLVEDSAWWLTHSSGNPVRAPRHAERLKWLFCGWCVEFGANSFAASRALAQARDYAKAIFDLGDRMHLPPPEEMRQRMREIPPCSVLTSSHEFYPHYPVTVEGELIFGAQAIDVNDCARVLMEVTGLNDLLASREVA